MYIVLLVQHTPMLSAWCINHTSIQVSYLGTFGTKFQASLISELCEFDLLQILGEHIGRIDLSRHEL